ncbi:MAG: sigma-70 family RNA polymerase sigma factor [Solirubrobacterales bacterium]|nr:sigma-70 family RNA polymerase sigma factor [Solirubrobacterales bacterium]
MHVRSAPTPDNPGLLPESELWKRRDEPEVKAELPGRFLAFAKSVAIKYSGPAEQIDDLIQVASLGLMNAIDRFDPDNGAPFLAFASATINGELKRHFRDRVASLRLPRDLYERIGELERTTSYLRNELVREPTFEETADAMGCDEEEVLECMAAQSARHPIPIGRDESDHADAVLEDRLGGPDEELGRSESRILTAQILRSLDPWDRRVIELRFNDEMSQVEIAEQLGCSQMHVSRNLRRILDGLADQLTAEPDDELSQRDRLGTGRPKHR